MADERMPTQTLYKSERGAETFCFDYQRTRQCKASEVLSDPVIHIPAEAGLTVVSGTLKILDGAFVDAANGKTVPTGKGIKVQLSGGNPGKWNVSVSCTASPSMDTPEIEGLLIITVAP